MPGFDGTGPIGQGAMTGGSRGYCVTQVGAGQPQVYGGRFFGHGKRGRGFRNCFYTTGLPGWVRSQRGMRVFGGFNNSSSKEDELSALKAQADYIKGELDAIQSRIKDLENK